MPAHVTAVDESSRSHARLGVPGLDGEQHHAARLQTLTHLARHPLGTDRRAGDDQLEPVGGGGDPFCPHATAAVDVDEHDPRQRAHPARLAASSPRVGVPTNAAHDPVLTAREITRQRQRPGRRPRCTRPPARVASPASGNSGANTSSTGKQRSRAGTSAWAVVTVASCATTPPATEHVFGAPGP